MRAPRRGGPAPPTTITISKRARPARRTSRHGRTKPLTALLAAVVIALMSGPLTLRASAQPRQPAGQCDLPLSSTAPKPYSVDDWTLLAGFNQVRAENGKAPLEMVTSLATTATQWSDEMRIHNILCHATAWKSHFTATSTRWTKIDQTVGYAQSASQLLSAWLASPPHRAAILGDFHYVGIGTVTDPQGALWGTANFLQTPDHLATTSPNLPADQAVPWIKALARDFRNTSPTAAQRNTPVPPTWAGRVPMAKSYVLSAYWVGNRIDDLYQAALGRAADPSGRAAHVMAILHGVAFVTIAGTFYGSQEYWTDHGSTLSGWVDAVYHSILHRALDASGIATWTNAVRSGYLTRSQAAQRIYQSSENRADRVIAMYPLLLARSPDAAGLAAWTAWLGAHDDIALAAQLAASLEYVNRAATRFPN